MIPHWLDSVETINQQCKTDRRHFHFENCPGIPQEPRQHRLNDTNLKRLFVDCNLEEANLASLISPQQVIMDVLWIVPWRFWLLDAFGLYTDKITDIIRTLNTSSFHFVSYYQG